jgi:hypothetical protein
LEHSDGYQTRIWKIWPVSLYTFSKEIIYDLCISIFSFLYFRRSGKFVSGWFLRMCYGHHYKTNCHIDDIQLNPISAHIQVRNEITNESKLCAVVGGFHGVESCDEHHKPVMSLAIMDVY